MKNKIKILSIILFFTALLIFIPGVSRAYSTDAEVPINYTIKINKVDSADNRNLKGAKFTLKDVNGKTITTQTTDDDGVLSFGNIKTYGSGTDIYYIEEVKTPRGYILDEKETIEVNVEKTVTNVETGGYKLKITCQTLNYDTDITRYDFIPISTREELEDIGSGAIHVYDGKPYKYTDNTNYRLMNDIDLDGEQWTPISVPVSGIFDGNGYSIKNMTIASSSNFSYKEVGLFKVYTGIVCNLNMENVNIAVPGYIATPTSISGKGGVGAFAGYMGGGTIKNCTVSGNISSGVDNVGGLVGHTADNVIIKLQNCTNYANITAYDNNASSYSASRFNVGGLIGCAMCSLSVNNCNNEGTFNGNASNVGGLIGHVESTGYEEKAIKAGYAEDGNTISLVIGNSRSEGEYDLYLEDCDLRSLNLLPGGVFTVYDSTLEPIEGFENITLEEGRLRIGTVNIKFEGRDTYFVKDVTPVEGYRRIAGYIKVVVTRYWDFEAEKFRVTVDYKVIDESKIQDELGNNTDIDLDSISDTFAPEITFENVGWNNAKVVFVNCTNNGVVYGFRDVAGLVGSAHKAKTSFENCTNNVAISAAGYGKAGGLVAELYYWKSGEFCEFKNCKNYGKIFSADGTGSSAGMAAQVISNTKITNCINEGEIFSVGYSGAAGIVCDITGIIFIDKCKNNGEIYTNGNSVDSEAGGIVAKNNTKNTYADAIGLTSDSVSREQNKLTITNCENTGNIYSTSHFGGMVGYTEAGVLKVDNCKVYSNSPDEKLELHDRNATDKGGIAGYVSVTNVEITNCTIENVDLERVSSQNGNTYGATGGVIGNWMSYGNLNCNLDTLVVKDCNVSKSLISTNGQSTAGILGAVGQTKTANVIIDGCVVDDCTIHNRGGDTTYASVAGIVAMTYYTENITITNCDVNNSLIQLWDKDSPCYGDCNAAGIQGIACDVKNLIIDKCNVNNTKIRNYTAFNSGCSTTGGILAHAYGVYNGSQLIISECNVIGADKENKTNEDAEIFTNDEDCGGITGPLRCFNDTQIVDTAVKDCYLLSNSKDSTSSIMSGMVTYTDRKIKMSNCTIDNIILELDTPVSDGGTAISGFLGNSISGEAIFNNCDISNSTFTSPGSYSKLANISGIAGYTYDETTFNGCDVYNCKLNGTSVADYAPSAANIAGILGCNTNYNNKTVTINGCTVKKCEFSSKATPTSNGTNCTIGGLAGITNNIAINSSSVENCKFTGGAMCTGGLVGCASMSAEFNKVSVSDLTIKDRAINMYSSNGRSTIALRTIGGIIGNSEKFTGKDITVDGLTLDSQALTIGGVAGNIGSLNTLTSSTVSDFNVTNIASEALIPTYGSIGGLVGHVYMNNKTISGCSVNGATITGDYDSVAGLIGVANQNGTISGCSVTGFTGKNKNTFIGASVGHSGGLIGISTGADLKISGTSVSSSSITSENTSDAYKHLGGMIGLSGEVTFDDCNVTSTSVTNKTSGTAGGFIGQVASGYRDGVYVNSIANIDGCSVSGDKTISTIGHAGGMVGCGKMIIKSPTVSGITVKSTSNCAGGIAGITDSGSSISSPDVSGVTVEANQHAAGMVAVMKGTVTGGTVSTITISSTGEGTNEAGAVAGVLEGSLSGTTIDQATISSIAGDVGGAVGATTGSVSGVTVTNISVDSSKIIGGVVGAGLSGSTTLSDLTVDDATVEVIKANTTATYKGKYIGAPNIYGDDNDLTVDPTEEETTDDDTTNDDTSNTTNSVNPLSMGRSTSNTIDGKSSETQDTSKGAEESENEENNGINSEDDETKTTEESESSEETLNNNTEETKDTKEQNNNDSEETNKEESTEKTEKSSEEKTETDNSGE